MGKERCRTVCCVGKNVKDLKEHNDKIMAAWEDNNKRLFAAWRKDIEDLTGEKEQ